MLKLRWNNDRLSNGSRLLHWTRRSVNEIELGKVQSTLDWTTSIYWRRVVLGAIPDADRQILTAMGETTDFPSPYPSGSEAGHRALMQFFRENNLEMFRREHFSKLPSRRCCIFLLNPKGDPYDFARILGFEQSQRSLVEIELLADKPRYHIANTSHLNNIPLEVGTATLVERYRRYWKGTTLDELDAEVLYEGEFRITRLIRAQDV